MGGQYQERQQYAEREHEQRGVAREDLLIGQVGPLVGHAVGQFILQQFFDRGLGLARAVARCGVAVDFGGDKTVVVHHAVRPRGVADLDKGRQRDHLALVVAHFQLADLVFVQAELLLSLHVDLVGAAKAVEVVGIQRAQVDLQGVEDVADRHAVGLGLFAVDGGIDLGHVDRVAGEQAEQLRHVMALGDDVLGFFVQLVVTQVATVFDLQAEPADGAQALYRRRWEDRHVGFLDIAVLAVQGAGNRTGRHARVFTLVERLEGHEHDAAVRAVGKTVDRQAGERHRAVHARLFQGDLGHALDHVFGAVQARGVRQLSEGHQVLLVLGRYETGRGVGKAEPGQHHQARVQEQGDAAAANHSAYGADITVAGFLEEAVERTEQPAAENLVEHLGEAVLWRVVAAQQHGGQGRGQGQRVEGRDHRGNCDGQGELFVELPGQAADEGRWDEHRTQHQRGGDDRAGHLAHGFFSGRERFQAQLDVTFDVLHHHDGVVHHDTDGQYQAEQ